jgi:coenzyme PQQ precursor peptide PqqA
MAAIPSGIESCRNPVVLEKTSTAKEGVIVWAALLPMSNRLRITKTIGSQRKARVNGPADPRKRKLTGFGPDLNLRLTTKEVAMKWKTPVIIEIAVGLEINAYACAEVK